MFSWVFCGGFVGGVGVVCGIGGVVVDGGVAGLELAGLFVKIECLGGGKEVLGGGDGVILGEFLGGGLEGWC